jgi:hypothetical protein
MSAPQIGDTNVRGYVLPDTCQSSVEALASIYGWHPPDSKNPNCFYVIGCVAFSEGTEVLFDVIEGPWGTGEGVGTNVRRA